MIRVVRKGFVEFCKGAVALMFCPRPRPCPIVGQSNQGIQGFVNPDIGNFLGKLRQGVKAN